MPPKTELQLVNDVELILLTTKNDKAFEQKVTGYLCPLMLKLSSTDPKVVEKTKEVLEHITHRIKST